MKGRLQAFLRYVRGDLWRENLRALSGPRRVALLSLRVLHLAIGGFRRDRLTLHASALTFATLMSLVPALAITFATLKGMGREKDMIARVEEAIAQMPAEFQSYVNDSILRPISNLNFAALGGVGLIMLLVTVVSLLGSIEASFNTVWGVPRARTLVRKFTDYVSTMIIVPIFIVGASTIQVHTLTANLGPADFVLERVLKLSGLFSAWIAFSFLLKFMPNTVVRVLPAVVGGICGAVGWMVWQKLFVEFQIQLVASRNVIYGTFASVPLFLLWLYTSWLIVLLCAEITYGVQHCASYPGEPRAGESGMRARMGVAFSMLRRAVLAARNQAPRLETASFADEHRVPARLVQDIARALAAAGFMARVDTDQDVDPYVLTRDAELTGLDEVVAALMDPPREDGVRALPDGEPERLAGEAAARLATAYRGRTLAGLVDDAPSAPGAVS